MTSPFFFSTGGGKIEVKTEKLEWRASSKVGSLDNVKHKPGGGQVQIFDEKYNVAGSSARSSRSGSQVRSPDGNTTPTRTTTVNKENNITRQAPHKSSSSVKNDETSPFLKCKASTSKRTTSATSAASLDRESKESTVPPKPTTRKPGAESGLTSSTTGQGIRTWSIRSKMTLHNTSHVHVHHH